MAALRDILKPKKVAVADPDRVKDLVETHGISSDILPEVAKRSLVAEDERLLRQQKDTVAYQWATEFSKMEETARTCLYCEFVAKTRGSLKVHMRKHLTK